MKNIQISDEMYDFLINLSEKMKKQDNRFTASPYIYQIQDDYKVYNINDEGEYIELVINGCDSVLLNCDNILELFYDYNITPPSNLKTLFDNNEISSIIDILRKNFNFSFNTFSFDYDKKYTNCFLSQEACDNHIKNKKHHYLNPKSYVSYLYHNYEMEQLINFILTLSNE